MIRTLTNRSFHKKKGRNLVAILAIFLTSMMFTTLFTMAQGISQNMTELYLRQSGTMAHTSTKNITDAQIEQLAGHPDVMQFGKSIVAGIAQNARLAGRQLEIRYGSDQYAKDAFAYPTVGTMPKEQNEIALDTMILERLNIPLELGQTVTLEWKPDINSQEITSSVFTLCGWWEGNESSYASMAWVSETFVLNACDHAPEAKASQVLGQRMMGITFSDNKNIAQKTQTVLTDCGLTDLEFETNLAYSAEIQRSIFAENLPMYGGMLLVFVAGYFMIYNVFQISVAEDITFYGKLKTLGTTARQIRKIIYGQGNRLCAIGVPAGLAAGYFLGIVLIPSLLPSMETKLTISVNPVVFIGSALFSYVTVLISCMLPARLAGKVSPIEALRYTDADSAMHSSRKPKQQKRTKNGASLSGMAWGNLWRNRKRTIMVLCSLTLGFVLMSFFYAKNASFDIEKYLMDLTAADFEIDDTIGNSSREDVPANGTISDALLADIAALGTIEATGRLYATEAALAPSSQAQENLRMFYTEERLHDFASYDPSFPNWKEGFDAALAGTESPYTIYGADGLILEAATSENYLLNGTFDSEKFAGGNYCLAIGPSTAPSDLLPTYSVGEKVLIAGREFEVMAVISPLQPMVANIAEPAFHLPLVIPADAFKELWGDSGLRKFYFNVPDETMKEALTLLTNYQQNSAVGMNIVSRPKMVAQYEAQTRASAVMGYAISAVIAFVGVLNFANSMVTTILSRRREFAIIQSIGMTKRQLCQMLLFEGGYYAGMTLAASYLLSTLTVGVIVRAMVADGFSTFRFTLLPLVCCSPILIVFAMAIPYLCFRNLDKHSVVERLRAE